MERKVKEIMKAIGNLFEGENPEATLVTSDHCKIAENFSGQIDMAANRQEVLIGITVKDPVLRVGSIRICDNDLLIQMTTFDKCANDKTIEDTICNWALDKVLNDIRLIQATK